MFRLTEEQLFWWPVHVDVPDEKKPGKFRRETLQMQFEAMSLDDARARAREIAAIEDQYERETRELELIVEVGRDWKDVVDDDGEPVPFSAEALRRAVNGCPWFRRGANVAYFEGISGDKARRGN